MGGVVEACCLQPIDVIKTRLQLDHAGRYKGVYKERERERERIGALKKKGRKKSTSFDLKTLRLDLLLFPKPPNQESTTAAPPS